MASPVDMLVEKLLVAEVARLLWEEWDPIGARALGGPDDEYDAFIGRVVRLAVNGDEEGVARYLSDVRVRQLGLRRWSRERERRVASMVLGAARALAVVAKRLEAAGTLGGMSDTPAPPGSIAWHDLTVPDAERVRDFYADVVGWTPGAVDMGGYDDYMMNAGETCQAGVCHAKGPNAHLPAQWMMYVKVADLDAALAKVEELGGEKIGDVRGKPGSRYCAVRDPAGAVLSLAE